MACVSVWGQVRRCLSHEGSRYFSSHALELLLTKQGRRANRRANIYSPSIDWAFPASVPPSARHRLTPTLRVPPSVSGGAQSLVHPCVKRNPAFPLQDRQQASTCTNREFPQANQFSRFVNWSVNRGVNKLICPLVAEKSRTSYTIRRWGADWGCVSWACCASAAQSGHRWGHETTSCGQIIIKSLWNTERCVQLNMNY